MNDMTQANKMMWDGLAGTHLKIITSINCSAARRCSTT